MHYDLILVKTSGFFTTWDGNDRFDHTYLFKLNQDGSSITGDLTRTSTYVGCCTTEVKVPVNGNTTGEKTAHLSWGAGERRCDGAGGCWYNIVINPGAGDIVLINDNAFRFVEGGAEYTRSSFACPANGNKIREGVIYPFEGDFMRE